MIFFDYPQLSEEWWSLKVGKVSGTRFGKVLSNKKNRLIYELMNEILTGHYIQDDYLSDAMQYGIDNEFTALDLYEKQTGIKIKRVGAIISDTNEIHIASPDGISIDNSIIQEVKCTMNGDIHLQRFFEGPESNYMGQILNYFAVSSEIMEVHFISYCDVRVERPLNVTKLFRKDYINDINKGLIGIEMLKVELNEKLEQYRF